MLKLQGGSKSAIEIATQAVRKGGTVSMVGMYGARYNMFPLDDFFARNITLWQEGLENLTGRQMLCIDIPQRKLNVKYFETSSFLVRIFYESIRAGI